MREYGPGRIVEALNRASRSGGDMEPLWRALWALHDAVICNDCSMRQRDRQEWGYSAECTRRCGADRRSICIAAAQVSKVYQETMADRDGETEATDAKAGVPESEVSDGFLDALWQAVARGWATPANKDKPMDVPLAEAIAASIDESWRELERARLAQERNRELEWDLIRGRSAGCKSDDARRRGEWQRG